MQIYFKPPLFKGGPGNDRKTMTVFQCSMNKVSNKELNVSGLLDQGIREC